MKALILMAGAVIAGIGSLVTTSLNDRSQYESDAEKIKPSPEFKWVQALPAGYGVYQEEWQAGKYPMGFTPVSGPGNKLWMMGQKMTWSSSDAITWTPHKKTDWSERIYMSRLSFRNKLFAYGGVEVGKGFKNDFWISEDGENWKRHETKLPWLPRKLQTIVEFKGKLWVFGGSDKPDYDDKTNVILNDIWNSDDGMTWTNVADKAPWSPRESPQAVVFKNELWLMGGIGHADIWRTSDGKNWTKVTEKAPWQNRSDFGLHVYENILFLFGGRGGNPVQDFNDVWYSFNGTDWRLQTQHAPWIEQTGTHSVVFQNKLWLYNGKHKGTPRVGDVWAMMPASH
jgi:hypothetical protein